MIQDASLHRVLINALEGNSDKRTGGRNSNEKLYLYVLWRR